MNCLLLLFKFIILLLQFMFINFCEHNDSSTLSKTYLTSNGRCVVVARKRWYSLPIIPTRLMSFANTNVLSLPLSRKSLHGIPSTDTKGNLTVYLPVRIL